MFSVFLSSFTINLVTFYHVCRSLIAGYATHCLFKQRSVSFEELLADSCPVDFCYASRKGDAKREKERRGREGWGEG